MWLTRPYKEIEKNNIENDAIAIGSQLHYDKLKINNIKKKIKIKMKKICILDYGLGNIRSLSNALKKIKLNVIMHSDLKDQDFDALIIPGVGSFAKAMSLINQKYKKFIFKEKKEDKLIIGICLGMHLFFSKGYEDGTNNGLGFFRGTVKKIKKNMLKLPNMDGGKLLKNKKLKILNHQIIKNSFCTLVSSIA